MNESVSAAHIPSSDPAAAAPAAGPVPATDAAPAPGTAQHLARQRFDPHRKSPGFAAFLSVAPGLGQLYIGYYVRGGTFAFTVLALFMAANSVGENVAPLFGFSAVFVWAFAIIDAGRLAALYNHAMAGAAAIDLPENSTPSLGGSLGGGALLLLLGLISLSHTAFGFSLAWLESWWPLLPIGVGGYLLARGIMDRAE